MKVIIGNGAPAGTVVTVLDGSERGVEELGTSAYTTIEADCTVVVVGDKPGQAEQLEQAGNTGTAGLLRKILQKMERRKLGRAVIEPEGMLYVSLANYGTLPLRVILGDGVSDERLEPLGTMKVQCMGYVELREMYRLQQGDPARQLGEGGTG